MKVVKQSGVLLYCINSGFTMRIVLHFNLYYFFVRRDISVLFTNECFYC